MNSTRFVNKTDSAQHNDIHRNRNFKFQMERLEKGIEREGMQDQVEKKLTQIEETRRANEKEQEREKAQIRCEMD